MARSVGNHNIKPLIWKNEEEPSDDVKDISMSSAEVCIMEMFNVMSVHYLL